MGAIRRPKGAGEPPTPSKRGLSTPRLHPLTTGKPRKCGSNQHMKTFLSLLPKGLPMPSWQAISVAALNLFGPSLKNMASRTISAASIQKRLSWVTSAIRSKDISRLKKLGECGYASLAAIRSNLRGSKTASATAANAVVKEGVSINISRESGQVKPVSMWIRWNDGTLEYFLYD